MTKEERDVLLRWKKRSDSFVLVRLKAEVVLYASRGVDVSIIAEMVDRSQRTVRNWLARWRLARLCSVVTGHAGNENAAKLTRSQKEQLKEILSGPPSQSGIKADFWDVPALRDVVKIKFGVEYASDSSYQLLMRFLGMSFKLPDPFDKRRDEAAITARMAQIRQEVAELLTRGWEVYTVDEVRVEHEADPLPTEPCGRVARSPALEPGSSHQSGDRAAHTRPGDRRPPAQDPPREPTPDPNREAYSPSSE